MPTIAPHRFSSGKTRTGLLRVVVCVGLGVLIGGSLAGCAAGAGSAPTSSTPSGACSGVGVIVDFGILPGTALSACIPSTTDLPAQDALTKAGVTVEGTADYGLAVVCRVDGLPASDATLGLAGHDDYRESCQAMPPEFAYWSLWVRTADTGKWDYAQVGVNELVLKPGETLGLTFTTGTSTNPPSG